MPGLAGWRMKPERIETEAGCARRLRRGLRALRQRLGRERAACRQCGWRGDRTRCDHRPAGRGIDGWALPGAAWRGRLVEACPACGSSEIEPAAWAD